MLPRRHRRGALPRRLRHVPGRRRGRAQEPPLRLRPARHRLRAAVARAHRPFRAHPAPRGAGLHGRGVRHAADLRPARRDAARQRLPAGTGGRRARAARRSTRSARPRRACSTCCRWTTTREVQPHPSVRCRFRDAGHILGSAILEVWARRHASSCSPATSASPAIRWSPIPRRSTEADVLLVESTYGNRDHKSLAQTLDEFAYALNDTSRAARATW